jgi:hypothetical protein
MTPTVKCTVILKNFSDEFWNGGVICQPFLQQSPQEQWERCKRLKADGMVTIQHGNGSFRDAVELNQIVRGSHSVTSKIESRRGYKLATFTFTKN